MSGLVTKTNDWVLVSVSAFDLGYEAGDVVEGVDLYLHSGAGKMYLDSILYLEKIDNHYFAVVKGEENYVVVVKEEEKGKLLLHCSCPCEFYCKHIYAVLKGIQNGFEKKFYKVVFNDENKDLLNRVTNNDFILCIGYFEDRLRLINNFGEIGLLPILDEHGNCPWTILEYDENNTLERYMQEVINKHND